MTKTINLGKVGLTFEGDYDSSKNYASRTCVFYDHVSWASKKDVPAGIAPGSNDEYWQKVSERGAQGIQGERGPQGNSAFDGTGIELVNNLTQGGEAAALSAEQGKILKTELTELESKTTTSKESAISDFILEDDKGNVIFISHKGEIYTKSFNSKNNPIEKKSDGVDFSIEDKNGNKILIIKGGKLITSNFNSEDITIRANNDYSFTISDKGGNQVLIIKNGYPITQSFNGKKIVHTISRYNPWRNKNICIIGDSLTDQGWYVDTLAKELECTIYNRGWSGAMITPTSNYDYTTAYRFIGRFDLAENNNPADHHAGMPSSELIDMMVIFGGTNDWGHGADLDRKVISLGKPSDAMSNAFDSSFCASLKYLCYRAKLKYPRVPLVLCTLMPSYAYQKTNSAEYIVSEDMSTTLVQKDFLDGKVTKADINNAIREIARIFGAFVIDLDRVIGMPDFTKELADLHYNNGDMTHPSQEFGAVLLGKFIAKQICDNIVTL